jgi:hypothetical protein
MTRSFLRAFAPTEPVTELLREVPPGMVELPTGRPAYWTGKLLVGRRAGEQPDSQRHATRHGQPVRDIGTEAERVQRWILGSNWARSSTVDAKISAAPGVVARLRAWMR